MVAHVDVSSRRAVTWTFQMLGAKSITVGYRPRLHSSQMFLKLASLMLNVSMTSKDHKA